MTKAGSKATGKGRAPWSDDRLIRECLRGNENAWSAMIDKYKNLIFSIPIKYGLSRDDATDIFQTVCLDLLSELPRLRQPRSLMAWLIQVTSHKCYHFKKGEQRYAVVTERAGSLPESRTAAMPDDLVNQLEREQILREALSEMPPRCRQLLHMLFFEQPSRPYEEIAGAFRMKRGSIPFIRMRCLERLRQRLLKRGFQ